MSRISTLELLQEDIEDLKGLMNSENGELIDKILQKQVRAIILNLEDHLETLIKNENAWNAVNHCKTSE